ncbi:MAG: hypothetical protein K2K06_04535, partial [Oscillospiraceae bacterium]|nr:hypothetical protein [Oscillospiraceae bacterium]
MTQKIRIKKISESDIDLLKSCAELEKICIPEPWSYESFLSEVKKKNAYILVAFDNFNNFNQVAGFLTASYVLDTAD